MLTLDDIIHHQSIKGKNDIEVILSFNKKGLVESKSFLKVL
jgi:hypothetical protein